jgi:hypothetical protein
MGDLRCLLKCATDSLEDFRIARRVVDSPSNRPLSQHSPSWSAPSDGWTKVNWDASMDVKQKVLGIGLIARDNLGRVKGSMCYASKYLLDPSVAEAFGARLGAEFDRRMGFDPIFLEGDAQEVVRVLQCEEGRLCPYGSIIADMHAVLAGFHSLKVNSVRRGGNKAAHNLASSQQLNKIWVGSYPPCLLGIENSGLILSDF